jgi:hypothetical protein
VDADRNHVVDRLDPGRGSIDSNSAFGPESGHGEEFQAGFSAPTTLDIMTSKPRMEAYSPFQAELDHRFLAAREARQVLQSDLHASITIDGKDPRPSSADGIQ